MAKFVKERVSGFRKRLKANPVKYEAYKQIGDKKETKSQKEREDCRC